MLRGLHSLRPTTQPHLTQRYFSLIALLAGAIVVVTIFRLADPFAAGSVLPPCPFHALTHLYCPGCGTTRAVYALLHGDLLLALEMNPLAVVAIPLIPVLFLHARYPRQRWITILVDARPWLVAVLAFAVLRNLPWAPFIWLAPG